MKHFTGLSRTNPNTAARPVPAPAPVPAPIPRPTAIGAAVEKAIAAGKITESSRTKTTIMLGEYERFGWFSHESHRIDRLAPGTLLGVPG